jgi:hypothetical protein
VQFLKLDKDFLKEIQLMMLMENKRGTIMLGLLLEKEISLDHLQLKAQLEHTQQMHHFMLLLKRKIQQMMLTKPKKSTTTSH